MQRIIKTCFAVITIYLFCSILFSNQAYGQDCPNVEMLIVPATGIVTSQNNPVNSAACLCDNGDDPGLNCHRIEVDLSNAPDGACLFVDPLSTNSRDVVVRDANTCLQISAGGSAAFLPLSLTNEFIVCNDGSGKR